MPGLLGREERREHVLQHMLGNAGPRIGDAQMHLAVEPRGHGDLARPVAGILGDGLRRVGHEVEHHLLQPVAVAEHLGQGAAQLARDRDVLELEIVGGERERAPDHVVEVDEVAFARALARECQQVAHDASRALRLLLDDLQVPAVLLAELLLLEQELGEARDGGEGVVQLVRHT